MLNYAKGAEYCKTNSERLETSARIILKDEDGTDSFGLFLYHIAYEEMAKAIFCLFVNRGWIDENFVTPVFRDHRTKIFLFEEIFRSFAVIDGLGYLGGTKLGEKSLYEFIKKHDSNIEKHRKITNDFLYVGKNNDWKVPSLSIPNKMDAEKQIKAKIIALSSIYEFLIKQYDKGYSQTDNFHFYEDGDGNITIQFDQV